MGLGGLILTLMQEPRDEGDNSGAAEPDGLCGESA
jgi:hypothetical protein